MSGYLTDRISTYDGRGLIGGGDVSIQGTGIPIN